MKNAVLLICLLISNIGLGQNYKQRTTVVQYSASFVKDKEISLKRFEKDYSVYVFYMNSDADKFKKDNIKYVPTIIIYHNEEEYYRLDGGIKLELPENAQQKIKGKLEEIIESKFEWKI